jgi:hypothetical protein
MILHCGSTGLWPLRNGRAWHPACPSICMCTHPAHVLQNACLSTCHSPVRLCSGMSVYPHAARPSESLCPGMSVYPPAPPHSRSPCSDMSVYPPAALSSGSSARRSHSLRARAGKTDRLTKSPRGSSLIATSTGGCALRSTAFTTSPKVPSPSLPVCRQNVTKSKV